MLLNNVEKGKLFANSVAVNIQGDSAQQCRLRKLFLTIEWQAAPVAINKQELKISLTDGSDPFFLYILYLSEEDFQSLKLSQGLLVDFSTFPKKFVDLVESCLQEENKPQPKFLLILKLSEDCGSSTPSALLEIVETNAFKHLTHLSLKFVPATDSALKQYLSVCLKNLKEENFDLQNKLKHAEQDLKTQLSQCKEALSSKTQELETVRKELSVELSVKESKHSRQLQEERDRILQRQREEEDRIEKERREKECFFRRQIEQLEARVSCLDALNKEIQDKNYKQDSTLRDLRSHVLSLQEENRKIKENHRNCAQKNEALQNEIQDQKSLICLQNTKLAGLEQELQSKNQKITRLKEQIEFDEEQKSLLLKESDIRKDELHAAENNVKTLKGNLEKSNSIILKLQQELRVNLEKVKADTRIRSKHEQSIEDKDNIIKIIQKDLSDVKNQLGMKINEAKELSNLVTSTQGKVKNFEKELKARDNVIKYLNRQLTDACLIPQYVPPASLIPNQSSTSQKSTSSNPRTSTNAKTTHPPVTVSNSPSQQSSNNAIRSAVENDSAYSTAQSLTKSRIGGESTKADSAGLLGNGNISSIDLANIDFANIDSAALSAAFDCADHLSPSNFKHSTAKKKSSIPIKK